MVRQVSVLTTADPLTADVAAQLVLLMRARGFLLPGYAAMEHAGGLLSRAILIDTRGGTE